jgi:glutathione S-transferase
MQLLWTSWVTVATLCMYFWIIVNVGRARVKYQVIAPSVDGPPEFLRALRVQMNTVEQLIFFFPALWLCAYCLNDKFAALLGAVWIIGRIWYALSYYREAAKRAAGFSIATFASVTLLLGAVYGLLR